MGFDVSWVAFHGTPKEHVLRKLHLRDTGEVDPAKEAHFSGAEIPNGWFILLVNDCAFASPERVKELSADGRVVGCQIDEHTMISRALSYQKGAKLWDVAHDPERGPRDLSVSGSPPPEFESIRRRLTQEQNKESAFMGLPVDFFFDIPVETAASACGYRHDRARFDWGEPTLYETRDNGIIAARPPTFTVLPRSFSLRGGKRSPTAATPASPAPAGGGS